MGLMVVLGNGEHGLWFCCLIIDDGFGIHYVLCDVLVVVAHKVVEGVAGIPMEPAAGKILVLGFFTWGFGMLASILHMIFQVVIGMVEVCKWGLFLELKLWNVHS